MWVCKREGWKMEGFEYFHVCIIIFVCNMYIDMEASMFVGTTVLIVNFCWTQETHAAEVVQFYPRIPQVRDTNWSAVSTILNLSSVLFLNACLPSVLQGEWRLIFSSSHFGSSFSLLLKHLLGKGPTLLVIKDRDGFVFGGFASQPWNLDPKFYGKDFFFNQAHLLYLWLVLWQSFGHDFEFKDHIIWSVGFQV